MAQFREQEAIFHVLERTSFSFEEGYLASNVTPEIDSSVVHGFELGLYKWNTGEIHAIEAHQYICRENHKDFFLV